MIVAVTGHRPERLGSIDAFSEAFKKFCVDNEVIAAFVGMAEGADINAALACIELGIPYFAVRPWVTHMSGNPNVYKTVLNSAREIIIVEHTMQYPGPNVYGQRNRIMVDRSDVVFAAWDGIARGGTFYTKNYAQSCKKKVYHFNVVDPENSKWL